MTGVVEAPAAAHPVAESSGTPRAVRRPRLRRPWSSSRKVLVAALALVLAQLLVRGWVARAGVLSQEDLVVAGRSARLPLLSWDFLLADEDRFDPLADLLTAGLTRIAPLEYWPMAGALVLLQALASLAVLRLLRLLLDDRPVLLLPLVLYLFSPLALPAFDDWSAAVGAVTFQAGLAWICGDAVALHRTGRRARYALSATVVFAVALAFGEKAVVIPAVALAVLALLLRQSGAPFPLMTALRRGLWLWTGLGATLGAFVWRFGATVQPRTVPDEQAGTVATAVDAVGTSLTHGVLPALAGGPLFWADFATWADPPTSLVVAAAAIAVLAVGWTSARREGSGLVWALLAGYAGVSVVMLVAGRLTTGVTAEFALGLQFFPDMVVVTAIAVALVARAPARPVVLRALLDPTERRDAAVLLAVFFVGMSAWSTVGYDQSRDDRAIRDYLVTAQRSLLASEGPVLDSPVASSVVWGLSTPYNRISWVFAPVGVETSPSTDDPRVLGPFGTLVEARVAAQHVSRPGPAPSCGHYVAPAQGARIALEGDAPEAEWTIQLNYLASSDGWILVSFPDGEGEVAPVRQGVNAVYLSLRGGGDRLEVSGETPVLALCVERALVGVLQAAD